MIQNNTFCVCDKEKTSSKKFNIVNGLHQGTVNSPILFNIFINDLLCKMDNIIAFADDVMIYHSDNTIEKINANL